MLMMIFHSVLRYLGREGLVPAMYLKKLGNDRRKSLGGRRKSRLFSSNELRGESDDEDEVMPGKTVTSLSGIARNDALTAWRDFEAKTTLILLQNCHKLNCCKTSQVG